MSQQVSSYPAPRLLEPSTRDSGTTMRRRLPSVPEVLVSVLVGALLLVAYRHPWWSFRLYAPQYPHGLGIDVLLSGSRGDVHEIDTLNHYIGMASLATAAPLERQLSLVAIELTALLAIVLLVVPKRWSNLTGVALVAAVPLGFVADFSYWLYRFGHHLNPHAPLKLPPFTPELFGNGVVGQFGTFARPELGFWIALAAAALAGLLVLFRAKPWERERASA